MRSIKAVSLLVVGALAACTVGPDYVRPDVDAGAGWSGTVAPPEPATSEKPAAQNAPAQQPDGVDLAHWWQTFADPTLDRLVATALAQNLGVREAGARVAEARALRDAAAGGRYPTVSTSASVTRRRQSENGPIPINEIPGITRDQTI